VRFGVQKKPKEELMAPAGPVGAENKPDFAALNSQWIIERQTQ
jgi:hypothetical protein